MKQILRYLCSTVDLALSFSFTSSSTLTAFCDADWTSCPDDCKSTSSFCIFFGSHLVYWDSKIQPTVACSSTKAEYKSIANAVCELLWLQSLLKELGIFLTTSPNLFCDNVGVTYISVNPVLHSSTKHIELDYHFVRDRVAAKTLNVSFVASHDQLANILTKPMTSARFALLQSSFYILPKKLASRGDDRANLDIE